LSAYPYVRTGDRIADLRRALARREGRRVTQRALAEALGVHLGTVTAWEIGKQRPEGENLRRLAAFLGVPPEAVLGEGGEGEAPAAAPGDAGLGPVEDAAAELFGSLDRVVRYLGGIGPPGQAKLRKLDALEGLRRLLTARGALPDWWHALRARVEGDEL
jgi:transcriptional regulator with XRE-family HTH domain